MNNTDKRSRDHYEKYFKPTGEVRVPRYGEFYLNLDTASDIKVKQVSKEPYAGMFEPKNPYVIMEEVVEVLEPPKDCLEVAFCVEGGSLYLGSYLNGKYLWDFNGEEILDVIAWKYTSEIFEEMTNVK